MCPKVLNSDELGSVLIRAELCSVLASLPGQRPVVAYRVGTLAALLLPPLGCTSTGREGRGGREGQGRVGKG